MKPFTLYYMGPEGLGNGKSRTYLKMMILTGKLFKLIDVMTLLKILIWRKNIRLGTSHI